MSAGSGGLPALVSIAAGIPKVGDPRVMRSDKSSAGSKEHVRRVCLYAAVMVARENDMDPWAVANLDAVFFPPATVGFFNAHGDRIVDFTIPDRILNYDPFAVAAS